MTDVKQKYCFIDVETTGLFAGKSSIIQIAGYIDIDGETATSFNWKCAPFESADIHPEALKANNTDPATLYDHPPVDKVISEFRSLCTQYVNKYDKTDKMFFIAYNSGFDEGFVRSHFTRIGDKFFGSLFWAPSVCVMQMSMIHLLGIRNTLPNFKLGTVASHILERDVTLEGLHDASTDITITRELFYNLQNKRR